MKKIELLLARFISAVFHPLLMPTFAIAVLFSINGHVSFAVSNQAKWLIMLIVFINTAIAPIIVIILFKKTGYISTLFLSERSDRIYPMMVSLFLYMFTWYLFRQANLPGLLNFFIIGASILTFVGLIVTFYWKISIHTMSMGGFTGFLMVVSMAVRYDIHLLIILSIIISGMLGTARVKLNAHTPAQVYAGFIAGICIMLGLYWFLYT